MITETLLNGKKTRLTLAPAEAQQARIQTELILLESVLAGQTDPRPLGLLGWMFIGDGCGDVWATMTSLWSQGIAPTSATFASLVRRNAIEGKMAAADLERIFRGNESKHLELLAAEIKQHAIRDEKAWIGSEIAKRSANGQDTSRLEAQLAELRELEGGGEGEPEPWLVPADEFSAGCRPVKYLIKGWLPESSLCMVHGPSGSGKTFAVLDWAMRIAAGVPQWQGQKVKPGTVAILAGEGHEGLRGRHRAWKQSHAINKTEAYVSRHGVDLDTAGGVEHAIRWIEKMPTPPVLVVVDTVHCHMQGDENLAKDTGAMLAGCRAIKQRFGCSVLLVHHTGVSEAAQGRARGSSAWRAALDIEVSVKDVGGVRLIEQTKNKDSQLAEAKAFEIEPVLIEGWQDEDGEPVFSAIASPVEVPTKQQTETKLEAHKRLFEAAWVQTGSELFDGKPYVSRSGMLGYLTASRGLSNGSANAYVKPGRAGKPICDLLNARAIEVEEHGWAVSDREWASSLILQTEKRNNGTERNFAELFQDGQTVGTRNGTEHTL